MKKKYTAAVLIAAMFAVTQKLPMRFERAHAEGEGGSVGEPGTPDQQNDQGVEAVVSSEPVYIEESQAEAVAKVETVGEPEATEEPEVVGEPEATEEPEVVEEPEATEEPEVVEEPEATEEPEVVEEPEATEEPEVVEEPEATEEPEVVEEPEATEEPEVVEEPEATEEPEVVEEPEATEEPEVVEEPEATETPVPTETPIPTETPAPTETPIPVEEQQRELPAILMQIEDEGFAYVKTAGDGVKLYADAWMERRIGTLDGGQSVLLALDYEEIEENRFAVYVVFAHDGDVMEGYVRLSGLDPQTMDGEAFIREHENSAVKCDDYPLVNVAFTPKQAEKEKEETTGAEKKADASTKGGAEEMVVPEATVTPEITAAPEAAATPEITAAPEATVTPEPTATPECTPEPTEEPLNLPPIPDQIERNGYAYVRTAELEVKLYTDENLDEQFASIYEKGAVLLADGYAERASAKNYALHVYAFDGEDVVEGFVSLKRMIQSPLDSDLESGAADVDGLPVAETSIHWKKNAAPTPTQTPPPTLTPEPTQTPIATLEAKTAQNGKKAEQLADGQPEATDGEADADDGIALPILENPERPVVGEPDDEENRDDGIALPIIRNPERPVVVNPGELSAQEQPEATDGEADRDDEAELPIIKNPEQPVVVNPGKLPAQEQPEATDGEAEPEQKPEATDGEAELEQKPEEKPAEKPDEQPTQLQVNVLIDASNGLAYEGGEIGFIAAVSGAEPDELLFQWQYSEDGENWENIAGATGQTHEETVTPMNANGYWRVLVKKQAETQKGE